jgi:hypothetical protein
MAQRFGRPGAAAEAAAHIGVLEGLLPSSPAEPPLPARQRTRDLRIVG